MKQLWWTVSRTCESGACVRAARDGEMVLIGSTARPGDEPAAVPADAFAAFLADVKAGRFDGLAG